MHDPTITLNGGIDGTVRCECGWSRYLTYPGRGWGQKSIGIRRHDGMTKGEYNSNKLFKAYIQHEVKATVS